MNLYRYETENNETILSKSTCLFSSAHSYNMHYFIGTFYKIRNHLWLPIKHYAPSKPLPPLYHSCQKRLHYKNMTTLTVSVFLVHITLHLTCQFTLAASVYSWYNIFCSFQVSSSQMSIGCRGTALSL